MGRLTAPKSRLAPAPSAGPAPLERGSARERGYDGRWDRTSKAYRRAHPLCLGCKARGRVSATTVTDHVIPHRGNKRLFWDEDNRQPACDWCHNVVKQILEQRFEAGQLLAEDLRLDSPAAVALARQLEAEGR